MVATVEKLLDKIVDLLVICPLQVSGRCQFCSVSLFVSLLVLSFGFVFVLVQLLLSEWFE